ncbi:MAG: transglycosylase SLT domain-containing protein, partial [Deltaproteobacteria bacterium]|nr:transglycosylase SLT domain-containing protein [Deltaproteobacteria bacterium]
EYDFDWLMLAALSYQESGIDQSKKSHAGAIGAMQLLPSTAKDKNVNIPDISKIEANIHAGTKYLRFMMDRYFDDEKIDKLNRGLLAFASYNAGPAKVAKLRKEAESMGLDPNVWFRNVEVVAAKRIGRETVQYVSNIYKYYIAYKLIAKRQGK